MSSLPSKDQAGATIAVVFDLTRKFDDEVNMIRVKITINEFRAEGFNTFSVQFVGTLCLQRP